jgi:hypothetical protein
MDAAPLRILGVVGSLNQKSVTRVVVNYAIQAFVPKGCAVDVFDPVKEHLDLFNPDSAYSSSAYSVLQKRVEAADVLIVGTPDYHGSISSGIPGITGASSRSSAVWISLRTIPVLWHAIAPRNAKLTPFQPPCTFDS